MAKLRVLTLSEMEVRVNDAPSPRYELWWSGEQFGNSNVEKFCGFGTLSRILPGFDADAGERLRTLWTFSPLANCLAGLNCRSTRASITMVRANRRIE